MDDWTLLKAYAQEGDERAFATLVERHIGLVYGAAYRHLKSTGAAEEIAQVVFATLAETAGRLKPTGSLAAWLYRAACRKAIDQIRRDSARRRREHQHVDDVMTQEHDTNWREIAPLLDEAMQSLKDEERTAVLMRVFEERPLAEVGKALGVSDDAARKRVGSALDRLRIWFERRGVHCTSAVLSVAIGTFAAAPTASGLIQSTIQSALAHAATTTATTTSTSTILTTMASMKLPLALGLLAGTAVPISLGYFDGRESLMPSDPHTLAPMPQVPDSKPALSGLMAEWAKLRANYGPNGGSMAQLYEVVSHLEDDFRRRTFRTALVAEWATIDPEGALAHFKQAKDGRRMNDVMKVWFENSPSEAIAAMKANGEDLKDAMSSRLLSDIAKSCPDELAEMAALASESYVAKAFAVAARNDLGAMREAALGMDGRPRIEALAGVAEAWAERDAPAALEWVQSLESSEDRSRALRHLLVGWAGTDPVAALEHLNIAPPGGVGKRNFVHERRTAETVLGVAAKTDFECTLAWLAENPGKFTDQQVSGLRDPLQNRLMADVPGTLAMIREHGAQPLLSKALGSILTNEAGGRRDEVWEWARAEPPSEFASTLKRELARELMIEDSDNAIALARELIADGDLETVTLPLLANIVVKHPSDLNKYHDVFKHAPQEVRDNAIVWALNRDGTHDISHEDWLGWVERLPETNRVQAVMHRAAKLVSTDPDTAIDWANSLPETDQSKAYEGLAMSWSKSDSYETSQWIATLPGGNARDSATLALVRAVSASEPDSGWEWAQTIEEPSQRLQALQNVLPHFGTSASGMLKRSKLSTEETAQLQAWIANNQPATNR